MSLEVNSVGKYFAGVADTTATGPGALLTGAVSVLGDDGVSPYGEPVDFGTFVIGTKLSNNEVVLTTPIKPDSIRYANKVSPVVGVAPVYDITNLCSSCNQDYSIKLDITDASAFQAFGFQAYTKIYSDFTKCCDDATNPNSCVELVRTIRNDINADSDQLFVASARNPADNTELNDAALDAWDVATNGCPNLRLEVQSQPLTDFCGIPYNYTFPTGVTVVVSAVGFDCCVPGVETVTVTEVVYPEGAGPDVKYQEWFHSKNSIANSQYFITGEGVTLTEPLNADATATDYTVYTIAYSDVMRSGFLQYEDPQTISIAVNGANVAAFEVNLETVTGITF